MAEKRVPKGKHTIQLTSEEKDMAHAQRGNISFSAYLRVLAVAGLMRADIKSKRASARAATESSS